MSTTFVLQPPSWNHKKKMSQLLRNEWKKETGTEEQDNLGILLIFKEQRSLTAVTDHTKKVVFFLLVTTFSQCCVFF